MSALNLAVALLLAPLMLGLVTRVKARFAGRAGAPLLQPYHDVIKLFRKGSVFSRTTTWVFRAGPVVGLATAMLATLLVPFGGQKAAIAFEGDVVLFAYLLGLGRFCTVAAALDTGSSFEGMGAAREATYSSLAEPALFLSLAVLARFSGSLSLSSMLGEGLVAQWARSGASLALVVAALFVVLLAENSRIPVDDPTTHLELTMIHEVMVLDHGGPALGMIHWGAAVKLFVLGAVVARIILPLGAGAPLLGWAAFLGAQLAIAIAVGVVESVMARLRLSQVPSLLVAACLLSAFAVVLVSR
ncbi:MAG TPA: NADH-quinone oxidoreductase subunit H [Myxococcales bacterium]|nr:NADH-quinone oxidoreductase subunit H [Myxococcales bacterium]